MKVYGLPEELLPVPQFDMSLSIETWEKRLSVHTAKVKEWLLTNGYSGENTGKVLYEPVADGKASYMFGDAGAKSILIHLPYGDAYQSPNVAHLPKKEVLQRIERSEKIAALFAAK
jgi:hypothetical protein